MVDGEPELVGHWPDPSLILSDAETAAIVERFLSVRDEYRGRDFAPVSSLRDEPSVIATALFARGRRRWLPPSGFRSEAQDAAAALLDLQAFVDPVHGLESAPALQAEADEQIRTQSRAYAAIRMAKARAVDHILGRSSRRATDPYSLPWLPIGAGASAIRVAGRPSRSITPRVYLLPGIAALVLTGLLHANGADPTRALGTIFIGAVILWVAGPWYVAIVALTAAWDPRNGRVASVLLVLAIWIGPIVGGVIVAELVWWSSGLIGAVLDVTAVGIGA